MAKWIDGAGDLLACEAEAHVNAVNCVGVMGKGIALQFRDTWPAMFRAYAELARQGQIVPGRVHVWETGRARPRYVINLPTKRHFRGRSRLEDVEAGLADLARVVQERGIRSIAVPALGAGLGGLAWDVVRARIVAALDPVDDLVVHLFAPREDPASILAAQVAAWNRGDLEAFCAPYAEDAVYASGSTVIRGRAAILQSYRDRYGLRADLGTLSLEVVATAAPSPDAVALVVRWRLGEAGGTASLVFARAGEWRIVQDVTSAG